MPRSLNTLDRVWHAARSPASLGTLARDSTSGCRKYCNLTYENVQSRDGRVNRLLSNPFDLLRALISRDSRIVPRSEGSLKWKGYAPAALTMQVYQGAPLTLQESEPAENRRL